MSMGLPALNMQELSQISISELNGHQGALVVILVLEGEVEWWETSGWGVVNNVTHTLLVSRILTAAMDPDLNHKTQKIVYCWEMLFSYGVETSNDIIAQDGRWKVLKGLIFCLVFSRYIDRVPYFH